MPWCIRRTPCFKSRCQSSQSPLSYEIIAKGDTVTLIINGQQTNRATGCDLSPGRICLTSEGSEIHFKNITLTPIEAE